ncbi:TolB family protein, partial [Escherichia coli]
NVANKTVTDIPFSVKTQLDVQPSVRFKQDIDKDVFDVKMLRMAQVSPDGSKVAFEALGKIWLKTLPDGKMSRLTELDNNIEELYPQWSRDGKNIVFTTWNDQDQGTVQVISAKGGKAKQLTTEPGKYVEPTFSPDGELVVYRKTQGGHLTPR